MKQIFPQNTSHRGQNRGAVCADCMWSKC